MVTARELRDISSPVQASSVFFYCQIMNISAHMQPVTENPTFSVKSTSMKYNNTEYNDNYII